MHAMKSRSAENYRERINLILFGLRLLVNETSPGAPSPLHLIYYTDNYLYIDIYIER